jgi:hypothetical protein
MLALTVQLHTETKAGHMRKNDRLFAGKYGLVGLHRKRPTGGNPSASKHRWQQTALGLSLADNFSPKKKYPRAFPENTVQREQSPQFSETANFSFIFFIPLQVFTVQPCVFNIFLVFIYLFYFFFP